MTLTSTSPWGRSESYRRFKTSHGLILVRRAEGVEIIGGSSAWQAVKARALCQSTNGMLVVRHNWGVNTIWTCKWPMTGQAVRGLRIC